MKNKEKKKGGLGKFIAGALVGGALGVLFAPKKGSETRRELTQKLKELLDKAKEIDVEEVKEAFFEKVETIETELKELDKEKVLKIAKKKGEDIKKKTDELVDLAVEKGTPVLKNTANNVRDKALEVVRDVEKKLEEIEI